MVKVTVKNLEGKDVKELSLNEALFGLPANDVLLHQVYVALTSNQRTAIAHTKDRGDRAGSGKKPWRQKGTGRARVGSVRTPVWRKGGVVFGPLSNRNFSKGTTKKMRQKAVLIALSDKIRAGKLVVVDELRFPEAKTKHFAAAKRALGADGRSLIAALAEQELAHTRVLRNIPKTASTSSATLNVQDLLNHEYALVSVAALESLEKRFANWNA